MDLLACCIPAHPWCTGYPGAGAADALILQFVQGAGPPLSSATAASCFAVGFGFCGGVPQAYGIFGVTGKLLLQHRGHTVCRHGGLYCTPSGMTALTASSCRCRGAFLDSASRAAAPGSSRPKPGLRRTDISAWSAPARHRRPSTTPMRARLPLPKGAEYHAAKAHRILVLRQKVGDARSAAYQNGRSHCWQRLPFWAFIQLLNA